MSVWRWKLLERYLAEFHRHLATLDRPEREAAYAAVLSLSSVAVCNVTA